MSLDSERYEAYNVESSMARHGRLRGHRVASKARTYGDVLVVYKDGSIWRYHGLTRSTFELIQDADSVGRAINALLKQRGAKREVKG